MAICHNPLYAFGMIEDRLKKIEEQISAAENINGASKAELLNLLAALRTEIAALPQTRADEARSIATFAEASTHEATRATVKPKLLEAALNGLTGSIEEFETSHPDLAAILNRLAIALANMGM
jgi:chromosome segregation ATPase